MFAKTRTLAAAMIMSLLMAGCLTTKETKKTEPQPPKQEVKPAAKKAAKPAAKKAVKPAAKPAAKKAAKPAAKKAVKPAAKKAPAAATKKIPMPQIIGKTNKSALSYQPGEEMVFTFKMDFAKVTPGNWFLRYTRNADDNKKVSGKVPADQELTVKTSLDKPGFVFVQVDLVDEKGKFVKFPFDLPNGKKSPPRAIQYFAGAAVHPEKLTDCGEPADFDAFWSKQKMRLAEVPFEGKVERKLVKTLKNGNIYAVSIPAPGPRPATGYLTIPANAKPKSLPIRIFFYGYGTHRQTAPGYVQGKSISFWLNAHGQELGKDAAYYKEFFASIRTPKYNYAFDPEQNKNPETCFFNGMVMRILRTLEYLRTLPEWNGKTIIATGGSQGGLQTIWATALDPYVTSAFSSITWCCDLAGTAKAKRLSGGWRIKYVPALDYYDPVFMAKRIKTADVTITRAGLGDYVCPPSGLMICYKNLATPKKTIKWVQGSSHGFVPVKSEVVVWTTKKPAAKKPAAKKPAAKKPAAKKPAAKKPAAKKPAVKKVPDAKKALDAKDPTEQKTHSVMI